MQIIRYPHPTLRYTSKPLRCVDAQLRRTVRAMFDLMYEAKGVGLAANQVDLPYRLFVANPAADPDEAEQEMVFINPVISRPKGTAEAEEGCLSLPGVYAPVRRPERVWINAFSLEGEEVAAEIEGLLSRIVQHETDHLDGVLFIDRLTPTGLATVNEALEEFRIEFEAMRRRGEIPSDEAIAARLAELESERT